MLMLVYLLVWYVLYTKYVNYKADSRLRFGGVSPGAAAIPALFYALGTLQYVIKQRNTKLKLNPTIFYNHQELFINIAHYQFYKRIYSKYKTNYNIRKINYSDRSSSHETNKLNKTTVNVVTKKYMITNNVRRLPNIQHQLLTKIKSKLLCQ